VHCNMYLLGINLEPFFGSKTPSPPPPPSAVIRRQQLRGWGLTSTAPCAAAAAWSLRSSIEPLRAAAVAADLWFGVVGVRCMCALPAARTGREQR
jgi:hypothetical protein